MNETAQSATVGVNGVASTSADLRVGSDHRYTRSTRERLGWPGVLLHRLGVRIGLLLGGSFYFDSEDRTLLENRVLPFYQLSEQHQSILFVGVNWPTQGYVRMFSHKSLVTLDLLPSMARYGSGRHIIASAADIDQYFEPHSLDLVVMNGVFGWGLDSTADIERTVAGFHRCLRPGGHLLVGWNDLEGHRAWVPETVASMRMFKPLVFPTLGVSEIRVNNIWQHVYQFYEVA